MKLIPLALPGRLLIASGLIATGLIAASVGALVALPEHGAGLRSWIGAHLPGLDEPVGAFRWWVTPVEKNAFARRITTTVSLQDLAAMGDGRTIVVVGDNGTLLKSVNAGATWRSLADNVKWRDVTPPDDPDGPASKTPTSLPTLSSVAASPDGNRAIAVGESGTVLTFDDNGEIWTERVSDSSAWLFSVAFDASTARAIAVGRGGTVLTSDNNGETWTEPASGSSASLLSVAFDAGARRAIAVGEDGTVLTSDDNGKTWTERASGTSAWLFSVAFDASTARAIAVGRGGTVLTSDDNGEIWTERVSGTSAWLKSVAFDASAARAIAVGEGGTVLTSDNNGETWTEPASGSSASLFSVAFDAGARRAIAVGDDGTVLAFDDKGEAWTERASGFSEHLGSVAFDANRAIAVGQIGTVLTSDDYGETWTEHASGTSEYLGSVAFDANTGRAIAVGLSDTVLTSDDNGETWTERASGTSAWLFSVAFDANTSRAIAVGQVGTVLTSNDNGKTWTEHASGPSEHIDSVAFDASTARAIAVGEGGTVLISDDNGETWTERASGTSEWLKFVAFDANTSRAIAVGDEGTVLTSDDNGETWTERASGTSEQLKSVAFDANTSRAIAVGEDGTVLISDDNGETWTERASGTSEQLESVAFDANTSRAIAVGDGGTVLTSEDAGATWSIVVHRGSIYPAPLSVLGLLLSLAGLTLLRYQPTPVPPPSPEGIIDLFVSDRPLGPGDPDRLSYGRYAQGLSGLLRNRGTGFPITIAVTGEWGSGKSSFMRLLEDDLKHERYLAAWFNAWHDQNEENVLSSLLQAIRKQAVPRIFSQYLVRAIKLRVDLLLRRGIIRGTINVMVGVAMIVLVAAVASPVWDESGDLPSWKEDVRPAIRASIGTYEPFYVTDATVEAACDRLNRHGPESSERLAACNKKLDGLMGSAKRKKRWSNAASLREVIDKLRLPHPGYTVEVERTLLYNVARVATPSLRTVFGKLWPELMGWLWQGLTAFAAAAIFIANGVSAFGFNLRRGAAGFLSAAANSVDSAGRHEQLRRDFKNVSRSIGRNLVIFIDDLDRCQPEKVVETLEAVNFLVTAGECAVVMGMDYQRVQHCVGLVRKELVEAEYAAATHEGIEAEGRTAYAHQYLQKARQHRNADRRRT